MYVSGVMTGTRPRFEQAPRIAVTTDTSSTGSGFIAWLQRLWDRITRSPVDNGKNDEA